MTSWQAYEILPITSFSQKVYILDCL